MNNELQVQTPAALQRYADPVVIETIKQTVCKGASNAQLQMFLEVCRRTGLDPFLKEIWFVAEKSIIMAARDGYLRVANEHPMFDGIETRVERDEKMLPIKAVCTVWRKDRGHPTVCEAYFNEYRAGGPVWSKYPSAMISKVAEVLALKRSFAINGVVSEVEMDATFTPAEGSREAQAEVVRAKLAGEMPLVKTEPPLVDPNIPGWAPPDGYIEPAKIRGAEYPEGIRQFVLKFIDAPASQKTSVLTEVLGLLKRRMIDRDPEMGSAKYRSISETFNSSHKGETKTGPMLVGLILRLWDACEHITDGEISA